MRSLMARSFLVLLLLSVVVVPVAFGADGAAPVASFTYSPSGPVTGQVVTFDGSSSTCANMPCTYAWSDDGPDGLGGTNWPLGSGPVLTFTFHGAGTKYVRLTVTDALGHTSTTEQDVTVASSQQPPAAPVASFTYSPSGPVAGQVVTFDASSSTCASTPCTYAWSDDGSGGTHWPLGTGQVLTFTFQGAGTKYVRLTVSGADGQTATVEHNVIVDSQPLTAPVNTALPAISGTAKQGQTLAAVSGTWAGSPTTYTYVWSDGAQGVSDTLTAADVGNAITVTVTATNAGGSTSATSSASAIVAGDTAPPSDTVAPKISGTASQGQVLTGSSGSWDGSPTSYSYQWQDCDPSGSNCSKIAGATESIYTLAGSDVNRTLRLIVTATSAAGSGSATSAATAVVSAPSSGSGGSCTVTVTNVSQVNSSITPGAIVCLAASTPGGSASYGSMSLNTSAMSASPATVEARPGDHITVAGIDVQGSYLTVRGFFSTGGITLIPATTSSHVVHDVIDHNDVTNSPGGYGIDLSCNAAAGGGLVAQPGCQFITLSGNRVHDLISEPDNEDGDALRLDGWSDVTVTNNEITHVQQQNPSTFGMGHCDILQSFNNGLGTKNLTFDHNYVHDNDAEGTPFVKDGDVASGVVVTDNLVLRDLAFSGYGVYSLWIASDTTGAIVRNNTYQGTYGSALQGSGSMAFDHNVFDQINQAGSGYSITSSYNIYTGHNQFAWASGANDFTSATFVDTSTDDYRLASNPNGIGIDWSPASQQYGPTN